MRESRAQLPVMTQQYRTLTEVLAISKAAATAASFQAKQLKRSHSVTTVTNVKPITDFSADGTTLYFSVMYAKPSTRKHKVWGGDGFLVVSEDCSAILKNAEKEIIGRGSVKQTDKAALIKGEDFPILLIGSNEVQVLERIPGSQVV